jgi:NAD(P)-dependent dehydrogenase (short-subunit alcohol dehydrogenase family)
MALKTALVTGGGRGIGRSIVLELARRGWNVTFSYLNGSDTAAETAALCREFPVQVVPIQADTGIPSDRQRLLAAAAAITGSIDMLVNNAGMAPRQRVDLLEMSEESYDQVMLANLKGPFFLTSLVAKHMLAQLQAGSSFTPKIINIGSISAYTSSLRRGEYCISKAGIAMMTSLFADRLGAEGILVYEIRPGIIETDMTSGVHAHYDRLISEGLLPIPRWGRPEDIALATAALAEGILPYSTGEVINIDGGFHLRRL